MYIHLEAIHLTTSIFDTNDLATIRGSSMILEQMGERARDRLDLQLVQSGGSKAILFSDQDDPTLPSRIETFLAADPFRFFVMTWGVGADKDAAQRAAKIRQLGLWSVPRMAPQELYAKTNDAVDPLDGIRPALVEDKRHGDARMLSASVKARRDQGVRARPELFQRNGWLPPQSFEDIVHTSDETKLPFVVRNKLAVVTADGIGFGARFRQEGDTFVKEFDRFRATMAQRIEDWAGVRRLWYPDKFQGKDVLRHRIDVLVWGGDDVTFVLPASHLFDFLDMFFDCTKEAGLPHRVAAVVAQYKTPIRKMISLASDAEYALKEAMEARGVANQDAFTVDVFESSPIPFDGPAAYRNSLFGQSYAQGDDMFLAKDIDGLLEHVKGRIDGTGPINTTLSVTQTYRVLQQLAGRVRNFPGRIPEGDAKTQQAVTEAQSLVREHLERVHNTEADFEGMQTALSSLPRALPMHLAQISMLSPYVEASLNARLGADWNAAHATV